MSHRHTAVRFWILLAGLFLAISVARTARAADPATPESAGLVDVTKAVPGIKLDIRYATPNNFTHGLGMYRADRKSVV